MSKNQPKYLAINDFADALEAFPNDIVRQFTLLKEIDAKCISTSPELNDKISKYVRLSENAGATVEQKNAKLEQIKELIMNNLPCYEEKMTIANLAVDLVNKHLSRINEAFEMISKNEIPHTIKYGPKTHPAIKSDDPKNENKSAQSKRSESRREAIAAKKQPQKDDGKKAKTAGGHGEAAGAKDAKETTPGTSSRKRKGTSGGSGGSTHNDGGNSGNSNGHGGGSHGGSGSGAGHGKSHGGNNGHGGGSSSSNHSVGNNGHGNNGHGGTSGGSRVIPGVKVKEENKRQRVAKKNGRSKETSESHDDDDNANAVYCICQQVSFGEMIACDNDHCKIQWFHLQCVGLDSPPTGTWYCDDCKKNH